MATFHEAVKSIFKITLMFSLVTALLFETLYVRLRKSISLYKQYSVDWF